MYLLDTNVCVDLFAGRQAIADHLALSSQRRMHVSTITIAELVYGAMRSSRPTYGVSQVQRLMLRAIMLPIDAKCAFEYGRLKAHLASTGQLLEDNDLFIASTAISHGLILVTHDKGFSRIPDLRIEDWLE